MPRNVRCAVTKESGLSDDFIKINGRYYKTQAIYDEDKKKKEIRKELVDYICNEFLDYQKGQPFPPILPQKLKELEFYDNEIILETFRQKTQEIHNSLKTKQFETDIGRLSYMFAIVKNHIADVKKQYDYSKRQAQTIKNNNLQAESADMNIIGSTASAKNISGWLEGDDD